MTPPPELTPELLSRWPLPIDDAGDKATRGTVLVVAGSSTTAGAALLSGFAALRMGAGRLQIATAAPIAIGLSIAMPEAMVVPLPLDGEENLAADLIVDELSPLLETAQALLIGPGLDRCDATVVALEGAAQLLPPESIVVADASALSAVAQLSCPTLKALARRLILTPNREELDALVAGVGDAKAQSHGALAADRWQAVVTSFGRVDSYAGGQWVTSFEVPGLGTSGSGDVLAGLVAGAAARGHDAEQAACWATFAHMEAGRRLSERVGAMSFVARELVDEVASVMADLDR